MERAVSLLGLLVMMFLAWLMSSHKFRINLRIVCGGLFLQFAFAALILKTRPGEVTFQYLGDAIKGLLDFVDAGSIFVFGEKYKEYYFAFRVLPTIIFFSSLMSVLYYLGVMQWIVRIMAVAMQRTLGTSGAESLSAAANIFVGQTEAPLVIRPYVEAMTRSELMAVMVGGFATIAGGVMAVYIGFNINATHLLTASVISAPAALLIAKILEPEVDEPKTLGSVKIDAPSEAVNVIHAASIGAADGVKLAINVAAMLIAFLALLAMVNFGIEWLGDALHRWQLGRVPQEWQVDTSWWTLSAFLGYLFAPIAWLMGVESSDCMKVGELLGIRTVGNEFIAYEKLGELKESTTAQQLSQRSEMILTYALCGFANLGSIGIQIGGIGPLAPSRQGELAQLGLRAMIGGMLACFMTACVAGILV